ncbi:DUF4271 domain-containing protein [Aquimarina rhabdastrellae]
MEIITRHIVTTDWIALIFIFCLSLLVILRLLNVVRFFDFLTLVSSSKYITLQKHNKSNMLFSALLVFIQIVSAALFIYIAYQTFDWQTETKGFLLFVQIAVGYMLFILVKLLIEYIIATIFSIEDLIQEYVFQKLSYRNYLGLFLLFINLFLVYTFSPSSLVLLILFFLLVFLNCVALFSIYKKQENAIYSNLFYFILYLCTLEIAPYFILYKLITL